MNFTISPELWDSIGGAVGVKTVAPHQYFIVPESGNSAIMHGRVFTQLRKDPDNPFRYLYSEVGQGTKSFYQQMPGASILRDGWRVHIVYPDAAVGGADPAVAPIAAFQPAEGAAPPPAILRSHMMAVGQKFNLLGHVPNMTFVRKPDTPGMDPSYINVETRRANGTIVSFITVISREAEVNQVFA